MIHRDALYVRAISDNQTTIKTYQLERQTDIQISTRQTDRYQLDRQRDRQISTRQTERHTDIN